mgnify:CR=1 FL=1
MGRWLLLLFVTMAVPMLSVSIVSPMFDGWHYRQRVSLTTSWTLFWVAMLLNATAWYAMLLGPSLVKALRCRKSSCVPYVRVLGWGLVVLYWAAVCIGWTAAVAGQG